MTYNVSFHVGNTPQHFQYLTAAEGQEWFGSSSSFYNREKLFIQSTIMIFIWDFEIGDGARWLEKKKPDMHE